MNHYILKGPPAVLVKIRASKRAKRLSLRVSRLTREVSLSCPPHVTHQVIKTFIDTQEAWLRQSLKDIPEQVALREGCYIPFRGEPTQIRTRETARIVHQGHTLCFPQHIKLHAGLKAYLKHEAHKALTLASDRYAKQLGESYTQLVLKDTKSRWGSCSSDKKLMYSWRLIMAPSEVLSYVAAHEVSHLKEMNHSQAFWDCVHSLDPDFERSRQWLRSNGATLMRISFTGENGT